MKITLKKIIKTLKNERELLLRDSKKEWSYLNWQEVVEAKIKYDYVNWMLEELFTGYIYMTPSQLKRIGKWK